MWFCVSSAFIIRSPPRSVLQNNDKHKKSVEIEIKELEWAVFFNHPHALDC